MSQIGDSQLTKLAAKVLDDSEQGHQFLLRSLLDRWSQRRYRRALATAPVEGLSKALTNERSRREAATVS